MALAWSKVTHPSLKGLYPHPFRCSWVAGGNHLCKICWIQYQLELNEISIYMGHRLSPLSWGIQRPLEDHLAQSLNKFLWSKMAAWFQVTWMWPTVSFKTSSNIRHERALKADVVQLVSSLYAQVHWGSGKCKDLPSGWGDEEKTLLLESEVQGWLF